MPYGGQWKWELIAEKETDTDGIIDFGVHSKGSRYKVKEIVPEGYTSSLENNEYEFVLGFAGEEIKVVNYEEEPPIPETAKITVHKIWGDDEGLPPADKVEFTLYKWENDEWVEKGKEETDEFGMAEFEGLEAGSYKVEETEPEGYYAEYVGGNEIDLAGEDVVLYVYNWKKPDTGIKVVKTLDSREGDPHVGVPFELNLYPREPIFETLALDNEGWPKTAVTDENGVAMFYITDGPEDWYNWYYP